MRSVHSASLSDRNAREQGGSRVGGGVSWVEEVPGWREVRKGGDCQRRSVRGKVEVRRREMDCMMNSKRELVSSRRRNSRTTGSGLRVIYGKVGMLLVRLCVSSGRRFGARWSSAERGDRVVKGSPAQTTLRLAVPFERVSSTKPAKGREILRGKFQ
jgi:hypothetical protein